jgi:hypothetical protein
MADQRLQTIVGGAFGLGDGVNPYQRGGQAGELMTTELFPQYYELMRRGYVFNAAQQAVVTTTVGLATTYTGLLLANPIGSGKLVVPLFASVNQSVIQATQVEAYDLAVGYSATVDVTHTTPSTTLRNSRIGSSAPAPAAKVDTAATLPGTIQYLMPVTNTAAATQNAPGVIAELKGAVGLEPGAYIFFATPAQASVAGVWFGFVWAEVPFVAGINA